MFVHAGPFANIAHGNSSIIADKIALQVVGEDGFVVTEAGFGADIGAHKFCDIKCRYSELQPDIAVMVVTIRALKSHGGGPNVVAGKPLPHAYTDENIDLVKAGLCNMTTHINNVSKKFGIPTVVAINKFPSDSPAEMELVKQAALDAGATGAFVCTHWQHGGAGIADLARHVVEYTSKNRTPDLKYLYDLPMTIKEKINAVAIKLYGAASVDYSAQVEEQIGM